MKVSIRNMFTGARPMLAIAAIAGVLCTSSALAQDKNTKESNRKTYKKDLDKELESLERAKSEVRKQLSTDWKKKQEEIAKSLDNINLDEIQLRTDEAIKKVDFDAIQRQVEESIERSAEASEHIDKDVMERVKQSIERAKVAHQKSMEKHDAKMKEQMERAKKQVAEAKERIKNQKIDIEKSLKRAEESIQKAEQEIKGYQEMIYSMEADGLLDTKQDYIITYKNENLTINGTEQPKSVVDKYRKYFKKDSITIRKKDGDFDLNHHD